MVSAIQQLLEPVGVEITSGKPYTFLVMKDQNTTVATSVNIAGGYFLLLSLPKSLPPTPELAKTALEEYGLKFAYGKMFEVKGDAAGKQRSEAGFGNTVRLCWAYHEEDLIVEGIKRLRDVLMANQQTHNA